tara:strand:+ start:205 stop:507 length:303 start_codon:yes stop_codon:yes gene_type:complete
MKLFIFFRYGSLLNIKEALLKKLNLNLKKNNKTKIQLSKKTQIKKKYTNIFKIKLNFLKDASKFSITDVVVSLLLKILFNLSSKHSLVNFFNITFELVFF